MGARESLGIWNQGNRAKIEYHLVQHFPTVPYILVAFLTLNQVLTGHASI